MPFDLFGSILEKRTEKSYLVLPFLLRSPPSRRAKQARLSAAATVEQLFVCFQVIKRTIVFLFCCSLGA